MPTSEWQYFWTDAPAAYDGFSTTQLAVVGRSQRRGNPVRLVAVQTRDTNWQINRYDNGMYPAGGPSDLITQARFGNWTLDAGAPLTYEAARDLHARIEAERSTHAQNEED